MPEPERTFVSEPDTAAPRVSIVAPMKNEAETVPLLADEIEPGAFYSQTGMYRDKACNKGGWPLRSPNPVAHDDAVAARLYDESRKLVGLS